MASIRHVEHSRLIDAADSILDAIDRFGPGAVVQMRAADAADAAECEEVADVFTSDELIEGMLLLRRLGFVDWAD